MPPGGDAPGWNETGHQGLQALDGRGAVLPNGSDPIEALGEHIGQRREVALDRRALQAILINHLHEGAKTDGDQESDDEGRHGAAKRRLRYQQPMIGRFRDRLRQSFNRVGLDAPARRVRARHAFSPSESSCTQFRQDPSRFRITAI